jgi:hypothetical protein
MELIQNTHDDLLMGIRLALETLDLSGDFRVRSNDLAQLHESPHNVNAHLHRAYAVEDRSCHDRAMLSESVRQILAMTRATDCGSTRNVALAQVL